MRETFARVARPSVRAALALLAIGSVTVLASVGVAGALVYSYHGDDYAYDYNAKHNIRVCDKESDSNKVKAVYTYTNSGSGEIQDGDGADNTCATASVGTSKTISRHRVCEKNHISWDCDNWQSTSGS